MIIDVSEVGPRRSLLADVCIIGSGAAGITLAREFIGSSISIIVLEGGGSNFEPASQDPYRGLVVGLPHGGIHSGRARVLGGTTTLWAGQALPLFAIDFQPRDWVPFSGWPIDRKSLDSHYRRAEAVMQIPHATNDHQSWPRAEGPPIYDAGKIVGYFSQFTSTPNFSHKYRPDIAAASNITLVTHANAVSLDANGSATAIHSVSVRSLDKKDVQVRARAFVICCGGIETARLMLLSNAVESNGVGNGHDVVGRYFQDHPGVGVPVRPRNRRQFSAWYDSFRRDGIRYAMKLVASDAFQRKHQILHTGAEIYYPATDDDPIVAAKDLLGAIRSPRRFRRIPGALARVVRRPGAVAAAAYRHYIRHQPPSVGSTQPHLGIGGEQQPNPQSRVTLGSEIDSLGQRRTVLDWRLTGAETRSIEIFLRAIDEEWNRLDIADIDLDGVQLHGRETGLHGGYVDASHHMGTTRMGTDRRTSVVDEQCRVHGYENLYVGSSSVFPTGGFSNPTLTVLALCLRIADQIKGRLPNLPMAEPI